ncbi:MAG TPA: helix-turn-helix domain-containing protein [Paenibacillus sp.]|uniref:helix-turn-helix domain-containing protein n=1 Tax=Paenibacillus sp. TaxID=58172 RepID=UPI0028D5EC59|nr:helix-turn-helix domain-containing protein [Paenibacillus sp.]HUC90903.1 helix-turn-helix domain-containing protein [Paenibacillus sp.]
MSDLGDLLRKAREQRGYSLDDVQEMTKIRKRYLEAIEAGDYHMLPGNFYVRAFVKNYAETVGLDAEEVLRLYAKQIPSASPEPMQEQPMLQRRRSSSAQSGDRISKWGFRLLMWSFLVLIAVVVYVYAIDRQNGADNETADNGPSMTDEARPPEDNGDGEASDTGKPGADTGANGNAAAPLPEPEPAPEPQPAPPATTLTFVEAVNSTTDKFAINTAGIHKFEITVADGRQSWIEVRKNNNKGERFHYKTETGPFAVSYDIEGPVWLNIGATSYVEIKIDGVLLNDGDKTRRRFIIEPPAAGAAETSEPAAG